MNGHERRRPQERLVVLTLASLLALPGCAVGGALEQDPGSEAPSVVHLQLAIPVDLKIGEVAYEITGNGQPPVDGVMVFSSASKSLGAVVSLPSGDGYRLRVSTVVGDDYHLCQTSTMFDVAKGDISEIPVLLKCDDPSSLDGGANAHNGAHASDAAASQASGDAGVQSKDAAIWLHPDAAVDAATAHGDAASAKPLAAGNPPHDAGASIADAAVAVATSSAATASDAGLPAAPAGESCDECRLRVCATTGNAQRAVSCFVVSSGDDDWGGHSGKSGFPCGNPGECVRFLCADACGPRP